MRMTDRLDNLESIQKLAFTCPTLAAVVEDTVILENDSVYSKTYFINLLIRLRNTPSKLLGSTHHAVMQ